MSLSLYIAVRYFFSKRKKGGFNAISIISFISILGYTVGAASLIIVLSVFNGFEALFIKMYSNFDADLRITPTYGKVIQMDLFPRNKLLEISSIKGSSWIYEENALLRYNGKQTIGTIRAVDEQYQTINPLDSHLLKGIMILEEGDTSFAWVGQGLGYQLGIDPDDQFNYLGIYLPKKGKVDMLNPDGAFAHGIIFPLAIFGIQEEVDSKFVIVPLKYIQNLIEDTINASALEIRLHEGFKATKEKNRIQELLGKGYQITTRYELRESFFKVMQSEKSISYIILVFILLIAAFNTIGSLYMMVIEKKQDLFVFGSLGFQPSQAAFVFGFQSILIAISGGGLGIILGSIISWGQEKFQWLAIENSSTSSFSGYPISLKWEDIIIVFITLISMGLITSVLPAFKAYQFTSQHK